MRYSTRYQKKTYPAGTFQFGKYSGQSLTESTDYSYLRWYFDNVDEAQQALIKPILEAQGYGFIQENGKAKAITPKAYWHMMNKDNLQDEARKFLEDHVEDFGIMKINKPITIEPTHNLDIAGKIKINEVTYVFPKTRYFDGITRPVIDGKMKHIRGRKLIITGYTTEDLTVHIKQFQIVKK